jgi:thymidylate kinase
MTFQHILLEDVDLSGKSSAIKYLQSKFPTFNVNHQKLCRVNLLQSKIKELQAENQLSSKTIGHLYAESIRYDIENFRASEFGDGILQDSLNFLRSLAFHTAHNNYAVVNHLKSFAPQHPKVTKAFVFTASYDIRVSRLMKRFNESPELVTSNDLLIINQPEIFKDMDNAIIQYSVQYFNAEIIDTTNLNLLAVEELLLDKLK